MNGVVLVGESAPGSAAAPEAPATPNAASTPTKLAASSSSDGSDLQPLTLGALGGLVVGCAATSGRLRGLRRR
jgi:hypothetical protein